MSSVVITDLHEIEDLPQVWNTVSHCFQEWRRGVIEIVDPQSGDNGIWMT